IMATKPKHKAKTNAKPFVVILVLLVIVAIFIFARPSLMPATQEGRAGFLGQQPVETPIEEPEVPEAPVEEPSPIITPSGNPPQYKVISFINRPTNPKVGDTATLTVNVKNVGADATTETTVEFFVDGALIATE